MRYQLYLSLIVDILLSGHIDIIITEWNKFTFHSVDWLERVDSKCFYEIDVVPDDILPELWCKQNRSEDERFPIKVSNLNFTIKHNLFKIDETDYDALGR